MRPRVARSRRPLKAVSRVERSPLPSCAAGCGCGCGASSPSSTIPWWRSPCTKRLRSPVSRSDSLGFLPSRSPLVPTPTTSLPPSDLRLDAPAPGLKYGFAQSAPCQPSPHMHMPFMQRPRLLQLFRHVPSFAAQVSPVKPGAQSHRFVSGLHMPSRVQGGLQPPATTEQDAPTKPAAHVHVPLLHWPWPEQSGSGQASFTEQSSPPQPCSQAHSSGSSQEPWPLQQPATEQSSPRKPAKQMQAPSLHVPWCEHSFGQYASHAAAV
mmetsp:Transcript_63922/g.187508  ORF Transcript_63922/g.187508 Transcript_63922/m.187508 type:complete len:266 (+) Transcript_63922:1205-2002(+)